MPTRPYFPPTSFGFQEQPFNHYPNALVNFQWDVLSLQPFDRHLDGQDGDIVMAKNYTDIKQLFADGTHLNNVGSYVVGCTYFATLYKQNPKGLPSAPYKVEDAKLAAIIQDVVWKVVSTNELAGANP